MRRLAKQDREDRVNSNRDYQKISSGDAFVFKLAPSNRKITFVGDNLSSGLCFFGMYIRTHKHCDIEVVITESGGSEKSNTLHIDGHWIRVGFQVGEFKIGKVKVEIKFPASIALVHIWGLAFGQLNQVKAEGLQGLTPSNILDAHLAPESFFLNHAESAFLPEKKSAFEVKPSISVKKCAYCQRLLPVDPKRILQLGFHKHSAKLSGHQNECRACKKFRINDFFNPKRTSDQLHESSVITREKKVLLREPEILQEFKNRHNGEGLRTYIWKLFGEKCFKCNKVVKLNEFELDHTRPLSYLWPLDEHATCLCDKCNNFKKDRFPVDFYTPEEIKKLSQVIGLSVESLTKKEINKAELARIKKDLINFANECDPRTFRSIAVRVKEHNASDDLFELLKSMDPKAHKILLKKLATRPE